MPSRLSGKKVRNKMLSLNITPAQLALKSSLSPSTIDRIINDRATKYNDYTIQRIADSLGCSVFDLFDEEIVESALADASSQMVEEMVVKAVAEAVTVVVEEVAPETTIQGVAESMPNISTPVPPALDVSRYFTYIQEEHRREVEELQEMHREHLQDLRREKSAWRLLAIIANSLLAIGILTFLLLH